jgi:hypothetical protein
MFGLDQKARLQGLKPLFVRGLTAGLKPRPSQSRRYKPRSSKTCVSSCTCANPSRPRAACSKQAFVRWRVFCCG